MDIKWRKTEEELPEFRMGKMVDVLFYLDRVPVHIVGKYGSFKDVTPPAWWITLDAEAEMFDEIIDRLPTYWCYLNRPSQVDDNYLTTRTIHIDGEIIYWKYGCDTSID